MTVATIEFLVKEELEGFAFNPERKEGLSFQSNEPPFNLSIKPKNPEADGFGHREGVVIRTTKRVPCTREQASFVAAFIEDRVVPYGASPMKLPFENKGELIVDRAGHRQKGKTFWFEWLPSDLQQLVDQTLEEMYREVTRFLKLLRWQQNEPLQLLGRPSPYWRVAEDTHYHLVPFRGSSFSTASMGGFAWTDEDATEVGYLWGKTEADEPLAHELRGEAIQIAESSPRSALLMIASALEVGVKAHISRMAAHTDWLVFNMPSPPIFKILRDYLRTLHPTEPPPINWDALSPLFKKCQKLAEDRNKLTHAGAAPTIEEIERYLTAVTDTLYILDFLEGESWAAEHVSHGTRKVLGWADPRKKRVFIQISSGPTVG